MPGYYYTAELDCTEDQAIRYCWIPHGVVGYCRRPTRFLLLHLLQAWDCSGFMCPPIFFELLTRPHCSLAGLHPPL